MSELWTGFSFSVNADIDFCLLHTKIEFAEADRHEHTRWQKKSWCILPLAFGSGTLDGFRLSACIQLCWAVSPASFCCRACVAFAFSWLLFLPCCVWSGPIWRHFRHSWWSRIPSAHVLSCWAKHIQNGPQPNMCSMFTKSWARMFSLYKEKIYILCLPIMVKVSFFFLNYKNPTQLLHHLLKPNTWPS